VPRIQPSKKTRHFQGIKGTAASTTVKNLPPEKGEIIGKAFGEVTITFTLPSKWLERGYMS
jgi:hypothetical protein